MSLFIIEEMRNFSFYQRRHWKFPTFGLADLKSPESVCQLLTGKAATESKSQNETKEAT